MIEKDKNYCNYGQKRLENISFVDDDIARAKFDVKPIKVSVADMIKNKYLNIGENFSFKDGVPVATLTNEGKLDYHGEILDMHTCAAKARNVKAKRLNGFDYWYVVRDDKLVPISAVREKYREALNEKHS